MSTLRETFIEILEDNIENMSRKEAKYYIENDAIPDSGSVAGLIMYGETEPIGAQFHSELMELVKDTYGEMEECPSLNDLVWIGWSAMLPEIADEVLKTVRIEIQVPHSMIVAFNEMADGLWVDAYTFVDYCNPQRVGLDTEIAADMEGFTKELQAYVFYKIDDAEDMDAIETACEEIETAYLDDEENVDLVS